MSNDDCMFIKNIAVIAVFSVCIAGCSIEQSQSQNDESLDWVQDAELEPEQRMLALATGSDAYVAFADEFAAKGYVPAPEQAVNLGASERGTVYVLPFETGSDTLIAAVAFEFDGEDLVGVSAAEYQSYDVNSGVVYSYDDSRVHSESLDPTFRAFKDWWACFWRNAGEACLGAVKCYGEGPGMWACVRDVCGAGGALWAVACLA
jgi:hypothetical protein